MSRESNSCTASWGSKQDPQHDLFCCCCGCCCCFCFFLFLGFPFFAFFVLVDPLHHAYMSTAIGPGRQTMYVRVSRWLKTGRTSLPPRKWSGICVFGFLFFVFLEPANPGLPLRGYGQGCLARHCATRFTRQRCWIDPEGKDDVKENFLRAVK